jgi:hypothetical protein
LAPVEQQIEPGVEERVVNPYYVDERREVRAKASDRIETEAPANERVSFDRSRRYPRRSRSLERLVEIAVVLAREVTGRRDREFPSAS